MDIINKSRKLAFLLRHDRNYAFDEHGWRKVSDLVEYHGFTMYELYEIVETAINVGKRHGTPVVVMVDAKRMSEDGFVFYQSRNGVWLTSDIPSKYLRLVTNNK